MEIEFVIAPPPGFELAALEQIALLRAAYTRGRVDKRGTGADGYWFTRFGVERQGDWPAAPWRLPAAAAGDSYWLCADPVHLQIDRDQLLLQQAAVGDLAVAEAEQVVAMLNRHFEADGLRLHAVSPLEWVMQSPRSLDLAAPAPGRVAGRPAGPFLPRGADAAWARRVTNEAQMLLHGSPVNQARENAGRAPLNSLWLWGGGRREPANATHKSRLLKVFSSVKHVREMAENSGAAAGLLPDSWPELASAEKSQEIDKALIDLTEIPASSDWPAILQANWLLPGEAAANSGNTPFWCDFVTQSASTRARLYHRDLFHFLVRNSLAKLVDTQQNRRN